MTPYQALQAFVEWFDLMISMAWWGEWIVVGLLVFCCWCMAVAMLEE